MPSEASVRAWAQGVNGADEVFPAQYARAREAGLRNMAEEIREIADESAQLETGHEIQAARLRVDARKWLLSKMLPREFGDRLDVNQSGDLKINVVTGIDAAPGTRIPVNVDG